MTAARIVTSDAAGIELPINALKRGAAIGIPAETVSGWRQTLVAPVPSLRFMQLKVGLASIRSLLTLPRVNWRAARP